MQLVVFEYLDAEESEVIIQLTDGEISLLAYSYPFQQPANPNDVELFSFLTENIVREHEFSVPIKTNASCFSYHLTARVVDRSECLVQVKNIKIILDTWIPGDIQNGEYISFDVGRLDFDTDE